MAKNINTDMLKDRKSAIQRIFGLFGSQSNANKLIKSEDSIKETTFNLKDQQGQSESGLSHAYHSHVYGTYLSKMSSKARIAEYYTMSYDTELNYALTEIADEIVADNHEGKLFGIKFRSEIADEIKELVIEEFRLLMKDQLRLDNYNTVWDWVYKWLVQGIVIFKIKFNKDKNTGVEGLEEVNPWEVFKLKQEDSDEKEYYAIKENEKDEVGYKYDWAEILQIDSGFYQDGEYFSILEFAKKDWRRLNLIEDSTVIYKLSRSPLRRIFKVFVGKMAPKDVEAYLNTFRMRMKEDISYDATKGEVVGLNPITILDDYYFPVYEGGTNGVEVETLTEKDQGWDANEEIKYFLGKVYRALKIPKGRMNLQEEGETNNTWAGSRNGEITRDEIKFSKFIKRLKNRFLEKFIQELFYRHLFYRNLIEKLDISKSDFNIVFLYDNPYSELKEQELIETRIENFGNILANGEGNINWRFAAKKYLKWTEEDFKENLIAFQQDRKYLGIVGPKPEEEFAGESNLPGGGGGGVGTETEIPEPNIENEETDLKSKVENELTELPPENIEKF